MDASRRENAENRHTISSFIATPYVRYGVATPILAVVGSNYITTT